MTSPIHAPVPVVVLSHRKNLYIADTLRSIERYGSGLGDVIVVDDSGDNDHLERLDTRSIPWVASSIWCTSVGYLDAMRTVWVIARALADQTGSNYVMLWEEDFRAVRPFDVTDMIAVMDDNPRLAHLNLQRQAVYPVERRYGYMESHARRGYSLRRAEVNGVQWIARDTPFTTNPGLIRREVLDIEWPSREECDAFEGGAEPAMSDKLEENCWFFGWLGRWNQIYTYHAGTVRKSGHGY